ncbi:MAG TPA: A24 family peptidase [Vicinamibacterales bacterium]|nr:A24 family peptidase [Vicinamibacterales bacterium]
MNLDPAQTALLAIVGLAVGSFLNVCIHRLPRQQSLNSPPSRCPHCDYQLRWFDNIPLVSYAMLGGRCRKCRTRISIRYPIVELVTMGLFVLHGAVFGWSALLIPRLVFACGMVVLFAIDLEHHLLPNAITLPGVAVGLIASTVLPPGIIDALVGVLLGGGVLWLIGEAYFRFSGHEGMGGGDVKMLAMIGAFLGWKLVLVTLVLSSVVGSGIGLIVIAIRKGGMKYALPYGTFLALGALVASLAGEAIVNWYVGLY